MCFLKETARRKNKIVIPWLFNFWAEIYKIVDYDLSLWRLLLWAVRYLVFLFKLDGDSAAGWASRCWDLVRKWLKNIWWRFCIERARHLGFMVAYLLIDLLFWMTRYSTITFSIFKPQLDYWQFSSDDL